MNAEEKYRVDNDPSNIHFQEYLQKFGEGIFELCSDCENETESTKNIFKDKDATRTVSQVTSRITNNDRRVSKW
jgi:hypothetical protein